MKMTMMKLLQSLVMLASIVLMAATGLADKVTLKDGRVVEGTISRELDGNVWIKHGTAGIEREEFFTSDEIKTVERGPGATKAATDEADTTPAVAAAPVKPGTPKATVITLGDEVNGNMVGVYMTATQLERAIPDLEKLLGTDGTGIVVLRIHSGGGMAIEVQKLSDVIEKEYKKRWRTVAWIDTAISAAAMTAHCMEEIYFTNQGNYGACTMFSGQLVAAKGRQLEQVLAQMEGISKRGNHNSLIMRAMQIQQPLSATVKENGEVEFYGDTTSGDFIVNRPGEILTLNAVTAERIKFSKGTADSIQELTKLMGYQELDWVGKPVKGVPWPVSSAEKAQMEFRKKVKEDEDRTREYYTGYVSAINAAAAMPPDERGKFLGKARSALDTIKRMVQNNPNFALTAFNMNNEQFKEWVAEQEKTIRELARR